MNSATTIMDNDSNYEEDDVLSLRDLQMYDHTPTSSTRSSPRTSSAQELFEFFPILSNPTGTRDIMFCGKLITDSNDKLNDEELINNQYQNQNQNRNQNRDNLRVMGSTSFRLPERSTEKAVPLRSVSNRDLGSPNRRAKFSTSKSKGRMYMFGPMKFMHETEMRSIRERQGRRGAPLRMFPVVAEGGGDVVSVRQKSIVSCRARLNSVFERSLACLRS